MPASLLRFARACRALFVPITLTAAVVAGAYASDTIAIDWHTPLLIRSKSEPVVAAAATSGPVAREPLSTCTPPADTPVPDMVGSIFRCRLAEAGYAPERVRVVAAEAVAVAQCESKFDPSARVFDGRYQQSPHPGTGTFYSATGVFQFIRDRADRWIAGGFANATDPVANIDAAARVYIHNDQRGYPGWSDWACAAANDGFRATSVLPGWPGGPAQLPDWAWQH